MKNTGVFQNRSFINDIETDICIYLFHYGLRMVLVVCVDMSILHHKRWGGMTRPETMEWFLFCFSTQMAPWL